MADYNMGIGVMSGTSLDGLDIVACRFSEVNGSTHFDIIASATIDFTDSWRDRLTFDEAISGYDLKKLDLDLGTFIGEQVAQFIEDEDLSPDFIASHGHTWFHDPARRLNYQLGDGFEIYRLAGIPVVNDFRSLDIRLSGEGAPLVPIGDELLFPEYDCCVNLGGIANISGKMEGKRLSYDIVPFNLVLNKLAGLLGYSFDRDGAEASEGRVNSQFLGALNAMDYLRKAPPKSLGIEWVKSVIHPLLAKFEQVSVRDMLHTYVAFAAKQLADSFDFFDSKEKILVTGGGAHNRYFIDRLRSVAGDASSIIVPERNITDFKEAIIFAFLGKLRLENKINCLKEVTGADSSVSGGIIYDHRII